MPLSTEAAVQCQAPEEGQKGREDQELVTFSPVRALTQGIGLNLERLRHVTDLLLPKENKRNTDNLSFFGFSHSKKTLGQPRRLGKLDIQGFTRGSWEKKMCPDSR